MTWVTCGNAHASRTALYMLGGRSSNPTNPSWQVSLIQTPSPADDITSMFSSHPSDASSAAPTLLRGCVCVSGDSLCDLDSIFFFFSEVVILQFDSFRFIIENPVCDPLLMSSKDDWVHECDFCFLVSFCLCRLTGLE